MTEGKTYISPPPEADGRYQYYLVGTGIPVRIKYDESGQECLGEIPDKDKPGQLKVHNHMIGKILKDEDVKAITKEEFVELANGYAEYRRRKDFEQKPTVPPGLNR